jgi:hypothetical protein
VKHVRRLVPSHATFVAYLALFIALGGVSYAALNLPARSVGTKQLKKNAVTSAKVKNHALRRIDFARGVLVGTRGPQGKPGALGPTGPTGPTGSVGTRGSQGEPGGLGPTGPTGPTGSVDTSQFYNKSASDARFLGIGATAANAGQLGGVAANQYARGTGSITYMGMSANGGASVDRALPTASPSPIGNIHLDCSDPATSGTIRIDVPTGRTDVVIIAPRSAGPETAELLPGPTPSLTTSLAQDDRVGLEVESSVGGVADKISADLYFVAGLGGNVCSLVGFITTNNRP